MFTAEERQIFEYKAQGKKRFGDPLELRRKLTKLLGGDQRIHDLIDAAWDANGPPAVEAMNALRAAAIEAFGLGKPFDPETGEGVMEAEWLGVWQDFLGFEEKNARAPESSPTPSGVSAMSSGVQSPLPTTTVCT